MTRTYARTCVRQALAAAVALAIALPGASFAAVALPTGPSPTTGHPNFDVTGNTLTMQQSEAAVEVDWTSFAIGPGGTVVFQLPGGATSIHHDRSGQASQIQGSWQGGGDVTLENAHGILMGGAYVAPAGTLRLLGGSALGVSGQVDLHGIGAAHAGDAWFKADYLEIDGTIDVGADDPAQRGTLHIESTRGLTVVNAITPALGGGTAPATGFSQVKTASLANAGGDIELRAQQVNLNDNLVAPGAITLAGQYVNLGYRKSLSAQGDITVSATQSITTGGTITTPGRLIIDAVGSLMSGDIHAAAIQINDGASIHQDDHDGAGGWYTALLTGSANYGATLLNKANQIGVVDGFRANETFQLSNAADIVLRNVQVGQGTVLDAQGHDIDASDARNAFSSLWLSGHDIKATSTRAVTVDRLAATGDATLVSGGSLGLGYDVNVAGDLVVRSNGTITTNSSTLTPLRVGGTVDLDAGSGAVYFGADGANVGRVTARGGTVALSGAGLHVGDVTASTKALLGSGYSQAPVRMEGVVDAPMLQVGNVTLTDTGSWTGDLSLDGKFVIERSSGFQYDRPISGLSTAANLVLATPISVVLNGNINFISDIDVNAGTLMLGDSAHRQMVARDTIATVGGGATLAGNATLTFAQVNAGGHLSPGDGIGKMSLEILKMADGSHIDFDMGAPGPNLATYGDSDSVSVRGLAQFDGDVSLDVRAAGALTPGFYHVLDYGTLIETGRGLQLGSGVDTRYLTLIRDASNNRIDLLNTAGVALSLWNANGRADGVNRGGGSGVWSATSANWTNADGSLTGPMTPRPGFAVFAGAAGQVHADASQGALSVLGMQFASDGYRLDGAPIELAKGASSPVIRVGDGQGSEGMTATIANTLTGTGGLVKTDPGTLVLTGKNTWTGGTTISGGTLAVAADDALGRGDITFTSGAFRVLGTDYQRTGHRFGIERSGWGAIDVADAGNTFTVSRAIYGQGTFVKLGAGTLVTTGYSTYSGVIDVQEGTLRGDADALRVPKINVHGTLVYDQAWDGANASELTGDGLIVKQGAGTLVMGGYPQAFTGTTRVDAGALVLGIEVSNAAELGGNVSVAHGAVLGGYGAVRGNVVTHGTVVPGYEASVTTPRMLRVGGNVDFASDSTLMITGSPGDVGTLAVNGHVTVEQGARLVIDASLGQWVADQKYNVVTAAGGIAGTFGPINSNFAFLNTLIAYSESGNISLILQRNAAALEDAAVTPNQRAVAVAAGALGTGHAVYDRLIALDAPSARAAFTSLAGTLHASTQGAVLDSQRQVRDAVTRHLGDADLPGGQRADDGRVSTWFSVIGRDADYDGNADAAKVDSSDSGVLLGADLAVGDGARIGALLGHVKQNIHERSSSGSADVKGNQFGLYGDIASEALHLSGGVILAHHSIDTRRDIAIGADTARAYASRDADTTQGFAELGYGLGRAGAWKVEPFIQAAVVRWSGDRATERGATGALVVDDNDAHVTTGRAGVHLGTALDGEGRFGLQATLAWQRAWGDVSPEARLRFADGGAGFMTTGAPLARNAGILDAGLVVRLTPALRLDASYTGQFAGKASDHGGRLSLNMTF